LDNVPNSDRVIVAQMLASMFCQTLSQAKLSDEAKLDRFATFNSQITAMVLNQAPVKTQPASRPGSSTTPKAPASGPSPKGEPAQAAVFSDYDKYIDSHAYRVAGKLNVAVAVHSLPGFDAAPLEGAMRRALNERGFSVIPIFRERFETDGTGQRLFDGDPSLATRLKLQKHCDSLLLGTLRFVGPAQAVEGGLYIREAVLDIHAIDPSSGEVLHSLEIREKGGGANAELSTVNALSRLEEKVANSISEWSLT
jgi:hypothetical protein